MEWYEASLAPDPDGPRMARWVVRLAAAALAMFLLGWIGTAIIRWAV